MEILSFFRFHWRLLQAFRRPMESLPVFGYAGEDVNWKLSPDIKSKWVAALRSGEYKKSRIGLQSNNRNCCLGVYCRVLNIPFDGINEEFIFPTGDRLARTLPESIIPLNVQKTLMQMNDTKRWSFARIADWIEEIL